MPAITARIAAQKTRDVTGVVLYRLMRPNGSLYEKSSRTPKGAVENLKKI